MSCTSDRWTCPHCDHTAYRGDLTADAWAAGLAVVQLEHAKTCRRRPRGRRR